MFLQKSGGEIGKLPWLLYLALSVLLVLLLFFLIHRLRDPGATHPLKYPVELHHLSTRSLWVMSVEVVGIESSAIVIA